MKKLLAETAANPYLHVRLFIPSGPISQLRLAVFRSLLPNRDFLAVMPYYHCQIDKKPTIRARSPDSLILRSLASSRPLIMGIIALMVSCHGQKKGNTDDGTETVNSSATQVEPLGKDAINRASSSWGIARLNDGTLRQGILIQTGQSQYGRLDFVILADVPDDEKRIDFAIGSAKAEFFSAVRKGQLANGLSLFGFSSKLKLDVFKRHVAAPGVTLHAIRLSPGGALSSQEVASLRGQMEQSMQEMNQGLRSEAERMPASPKTANGVRHARSPLMTEMSDQIDRLRAQLKFATQSISSAEIAAGTLFEKLDGTNGVLENTVLVGQDLMPLALRHRDQWVNIDEALDSIPTRPKGVQLSVSGTSSSVLLTCTLKWEIPPASASFSLVAATTHELESQGGGSLEERLAKVAAEPLQQSGSTRKIEKNLSWAGTPTTLWIKIVDDANPGQPVIDEAISLEYDSSIVAKWVKPPSGLIELPESGPDTPDDLVAARRVIDAGGTVLDMIPTADPALLLVQTDKPPFWALLDLKAGNVGKAPWTATSDTLVATQAGKTFLANRRTKEVAIWDNASSKRESVRLLELPGDLISVSAPRLASGSPVLVATDQTAAFVSPTTFKAVNCGINLTMVFPQVQKTNHDFPKLDPATLRARASADGAIYTLSGMALGSSDTALKTISMRMKGGVVVERNADSLANYIPATGRNLVKGIPDQGGGDLVLSVERRNSQFPAPQRSIHFRSEKGRRSLGVMESAPFVPAIGRGYSATAPAFDRRLYLDSTLGILLIPEGAKIHFLHLKLPEIPALSPDFVFSGETV
jgi:hypothetical protein